MKNSPDTTLTATLVDAGLLKNLVEELAARRYDFGHSDEQLQPGWEVIETSSIGAYVSADVIFSEKTDVINIPFITCFLFTCTKGKGSKYDLAWASSLS
jgi:hypothetical protein